MNESARYYLNLVLLTYALLVFQAASEPVFWPFFVLTLIGNLTFTGSYLVELHHRGCCVTCDGTGWSMDIETNGRCWDCYRTGHAHALTRR